MRLGGWRLGDWVGDWRLRDLRLSREESLDLASYVMKARDEKFEKELPAARGSETESVSRPNGAPVTSDSRNTLKGADVVRSSADRITEIRNTGKTPARFLVVEFGGRGE